MSTENRYPVEDRLVGTVIGRYRVKRVLDRGEMGASYLAEHMLIGKPVVIKLLRSDLSHHDEMVARFVNEAKAAAAIRHPGVIEIFDFGYHSDGRGYLVMEHLEGHSLAHRLRLRGRLSELEAATIGRSIASVLAVAHACRIVHRDLEPDNIFLVPDPDAPGGERIKVLDFGVAKLDGGDAAEPPTGTIIGTPSYMSPEQARSPGAVDGRADLYSLGCILYHMLGGRPPFTANGARELIAMQLHTEPQRLRELVPDLSEAIERATMSLLAKDPELRTQSARELADELGAIAGVATQPVLLGTPATAPQRAAEIVADPDPPTESSLDVDRWFVATDEVPSLSPDDESPPAPAAWRAWWIAPAIGGFAATAMLAFALVRSVRGQDRDPPPHPASTTAIEPAGPPAAAAPVSPPAAAVAAAPAPPAPPPAAVEPAPEAPPAVAQPASPPISHPRAIADRRPPPRAKRASPITSSPNGSPLEPDL